MLIGMTGKNVREEDWHKFVEGYFIGIDFTDRMLQGLAKKDGSPWALAKSQDGFMAVSDFVPASDVTDPHNLMLSLAINSKTMQKDNTKKMIYKIPTLIQFLSKYVTLHEGDMILTGTPAGVGPVKKGDVLCA